MLSRGADGMRSLKPARESMAHFPKETAVGRLLRENPLPASKIGRHTPVFDDGVQLSTMQGGFIFK